MRDEPTTGLPGWLRVTLGTVGDVIVFVVLSLAIWTILPAVALGATPVVISGGSMAPLVRAGDVMLLDGTAPPNGELFAPGTVLTYEAADGARAGELITHRVAGLEDGHYVTRGDANAATDARPVHPDQVVGVGRWLVPALGLPAHWARSGSWHLVALTALVGTAALAASRTGRPRIVLEHAAEPDDRIVDVAPPTAPPEPVLAFQLQLEDTLPPVSDEAEPLEPAAAERAATVAAQAARRGMAGLDRSREPRRRSRRRDEAGSAGSAPVASIVALALAVLASTVAPNIAAAAFTTASTNLGNSFTVAEAGDPTPLSLVVPAGAGHADERPGGVIVPPDNTLTSYDWSFHVPATLHLQGPVTARVELRSSLHPSGPSSRHLVVGLLVDGKPLASSGQTTFVHSQSWRTETVVISDDLTATIPAGSELTVRITSLRYDLRVGGPTVVTSNGAS